MLNDSFGRIHDYLRISLTDRCNLRCSYCHPEDLPRGYFAGSRKMSPEEIEFIASVFVKNGIKKIRLTGGEPLMRKDAKVIIDKLSKLPVELSVTTNGVFINDFIDTFRSSGIKSVNVSLDSLRRERNNLITRRDYHQRIITNINLLLKNKFHVKVNTVIIKNLNHDEILDFLEWTKFIPVHVRFIEFMPFSGNNWSNEKVFSQREILELISSKFHFIKLPDEKCATAKKFFISGHRGTFAVIGTMSEPFCNSCNRIRLTSDGKLKNCLFSKNEVDLLGPLRNGEDILPLINQSIREKEKSLGGQFTGIYENTNASKIYNRRMVNIGG